MILFKERPEGVFFQIKVLPRSSRCEMAGRHGEVLKVKITAPPLEGRANEEVLRFLARYLKVKAAQVSIVNGEHAPVKTIAVYGMTGQQFKERFSEMDG